MSLAFCALVPHPPMLLPSIGKEQAKLLGKTWNSYQIIAERLAQVNAETIFIISPHHPIMDERFSLNLSPVYQTNFQIFGDFTSPKEFKPDFSLAERIRHYDQKGGADILLYNETQLDYGTGVPLFFLTSENTPRIIPLSSSISTAKINFIFGQTLKDIILNSERRIAVLASADLSRRHSAESPRGYSTRAKIFDDLIISNLSAKSASPILQMENKLVSEVHTCGYRPICMLLGILDKIDYQPELLSYESPCGAGYAVMQFHL